jgi:hypothetical protein
MQVQVFMCYAIQNDISACHPWPVFLLQLECFISKQSLKCFVVEVSMFQSSQYRGCSSLGWTSAFRPAAGILFFRAPKVFVGLDREWVGDVKNTDHERPDGLDLGENGLHVLLCVDRVLAGKGQRTEIRLVWVIEELLIGGGLYHEVCSVLLVNLNPFQNIWN